MKNKYFKQRNGNFYIKYTKEEIYNQIKNNPEKINFFLKDMNYPYYEQIWKYTNHFGKYIAKMNLRAFKYFEYKDSDYFMENKNNDFN